MEYGLVLLWFLVYVGLGALALPAAAWLFRRFPTRGAGFALPVALATLGVVGYWVGHVRFGLPALVAGLLALATLSGVALRRGVRPDPRGYGEAMAVFAAAFALLIAIRAHDPAVHPGGGEKFLDFGLLNSLLRTGRLPPEDFWFAGDAMPYYYGGHMITALLTRLTGTAPRYAYNLALAGWYATVVTAAYALAGAIASGLDRDRRSAGLLAAVLVGVASNLVTPMRFLAWAVPGGRAFAGAFGVELSGLANGPDSFEYWSAHLVIEGTNNEFPFFAFVNGDMHAHMMSPPFMLLLAGALLVYWRTPAEDLLRRRAVVFLVVPPLVGLITLVNTWSLPTTGGLTLLALAFAPADPWTLLPARVSDGLDRVAAVRPRADGGTAVKDPTPVDVLDRTRHEVVVVGTALVIAVAVAALGALLVYPYLSMTGSGRGIGIVENRSGLWGLLLVHGVFLGATAVHLVRAADPAERRKIAFTFLLMLFAIMLFFPYLLAVFPFVFLILVGRVQLGRGDDVDFETVLAVGALGLVVLVEFVYVTNAGFGRYNTVFKVYAQVWALWGTAVGVMLAGYADPAGWILARLDELRGESAPSPRPTYGAVVVAVLLVSTSLYAGLATSSHLAEPAAEQGATLDAVAFVDQHHAEEAEAIRWVRDLEGQPNMVSAPTACMYRWTSFPVQCGNENEVVGASAAASLTGVPTLAGWYHEIGYRGEDEFLARVDDVRTIYDGSPEEQARLLAEHEVEYIYVGPAERDRYENHDLENRLTGVDVAHRSGEVVIYRVDPGTVAPRADPILGSGDDGGPPAAGTADVGEDPAVRGGEGSFGPVTRDGEDRTGVGIGNGDGRDGVAIRGGDGAGNESVTGNGP